MRPARSRGIALILALLILTILVVIIAQLALSTKVDLQVAHNSKDGDTGLYACWGGIELGKALLRDDLARNAHDGLADRWARLQKPFKVGEQEVTVTIEDEDRKLNVLLLRSPHEAYKAFCQGALERLVKLARDGTEDEEELPPEEIAKHLAEWITEGKSPGSLDPDEQATREDGKVIPPLSLTEFLLVKGVTEPVLFGPPPKAPLPEGAEPPPEEEPTDASQESLDALLGKKKKEPRGLAEFLTLWSRGRINPNTADPILLRALSPNISDATVAAIVEKRTPGGGPAGPGSGGAGAGTGTGTGTTDGTLRDNAFQKVEDVKDVEGMGGVGTGPGVYDELRPYLTVKSRTFKITASVTVGRVTRAVEVVVEREPEDFKVVWYKER